MDSLNEEEKNRNNMASLSSTNYCYVDNFGHNSHDIYNLATGMENMISYPPNNSKLPDHHNSATWKDLFSSSSGASSSKTGFYHFTPENTDEPMLSGPHDHNTYVVDDDSSLRCVFPCEGNERPSQGLSLSLSSTNPTAIGLQSFELRHPSDQGFFPKSTDQIHHHDHHNMVLQEGYFGKSAGYPNDFFQIRASKYLGSAQDLLNEICNLGTKETGPKGPKQKAREHEIITPSPSPGSFLELQKRKGRLLAMLEEVDRRYRHYCDQMKAVVSSFEAVAGNGAANIYSEMASKAMSRHFRALRDNIVAHIKGTKKAMGEKDSSSPGMTRGETPRLRVLDQTLRQQRAFQQMNMMESHPWRPQRGLPERSVSVLRAWLFEHFLHPYPSDVDKHILARQTGLSRSQVSNWFINARVRLWKPMVEEMYLEETKEQDNILGTNDDNNINSRPCQTQSQTQNPHAHTDDRKPTLAQLGRIDSECLSSIIINPDQSHHHHHHQSQNQNQNQNHQGFGRVSEPFGAVELDFSSYGHQQGFGTGSAGGSSVSLTLGLQQHGEEGVSLAFTSAPQGSIFYPRDHMEDCQTVQFSLLDGEAQNLPYRNLMGAQMLHDLAG